MVGDARGAWAGRGFVAAEMETALLIPTGAPLASLRVIIDPPAAEVSGHWVSPGAAALDPRRWREAMWLAARARGAHGWRRDVWPRDWRLDA